MTIHFYSNNEEETHIVSFYDMNSNPFKKDDIICLTVNELLPRDLSYNMSIQANKELMLKNKAKQEQFNHKDIKLVREGKYVETESGRLIIEYHCEILNK